MVLDSIEVRIWAISRRYLVYLQESIVQMSFL